MEVVSGVKLWLSAINNSIQFYFLSTCRWRAICFKLVAIWLSWGLWRQKILPEILEVSVFSETFLAPFWFLSAALIDHSLQTETRSALNASWLIRNQFTCLSPNLDHEISWNLNCIIVKIRILFNKIATLTSNGMQIAPFHTNLYSDSRKIFSFWFHFSFLC